MNKLQLNPALASIIHRQLIARFVIMCLDSLAISLIIFSAIILFFKASHYWVVPIFFVTLSIVAFLRNLWKVKPKSITGLLDRSYPSLEESSGLLLKMDSDLTGLEVLQKRKISNVLSKTEVPFLFGQKIYKPIGFLCLSFLIYAFVVLNQSSTILNNFKDPVANLSPAPSIKEVVPGAISSFKVTITPPSYTKSLSRSQKQFNLKVESGAAVEWRIKTTQQIKNLSLTFNNKSKIKMRRVGGNSNEWSYKQKINSQGFYQVDLDGVKSELYQIDVIPDLPVRIQISTPKQRTIIDVGQPQSIVLNTSMVDDYGISTAFIAATMASGKGEGVSFTEKRLPFKSDFGGQKTARLKEIIDLKSLGMKPGDELYFYVSATDNHNQQSRSDVYFVSIVDTTELMSLAGISNGVNLVPEYFRSQRQIIIDTEKLLKERSTIQDKEFKDKSNEIGIDQKLLRLRYGKFLGEESETEIGADHDHEDGDHDEKADVKFGDVKTIMDQYAHKHDIAEDATFFEPELKAQLKAVLTEMWGSELRLRTYKPQEALPYEYKALRLLKDLQQKSRAYVAKTTVKTSQLKLEKRLTGELDKILSPVLNESLKAGDDRDYTLRQALAILEVNKSGLLMGSKNLEIMRKVEGELIVSASANPGVFLPALKKLRKLLTEKSLTTIEISSIQQVIVRLLPKGDAKPVVVERLPGASLYEGYYNNLKKGG
ncbi:MAG: DUF4175 family protein [Pedobacter sp.]|nr:MAG: DUF4175 family protein [Pedobacter sp.]